jgi:hypothetical protein
MVKFITIPICARPEKSDGGLLRSASLPWRTGRVAVDPPPVVAKTQDVLTRPTIRMTVSCQQAPAATACTPWLRESDRISLYAGVAPGPSKLIQERTCAVKSARGKGLYEHPYMIPRCHVRHVVGWVR